MKFLRLDLLAYGPFTDVTLEFSGPCGLHVIYGPNEAGKSSALRAVRALLYGIEEHTRDRFLHEYTRLRIGATLENGDGEQLACVRRKARKQPLRDGQDDQPLDESRLARMLGGMGLDMFTRMFGIDHDALVAGGTKLLEQDGELGQSLFASTGLEDVRGVQRQLQDDAASLFKPRASNPQLNACLSQHEKLRREIKEFQLTSAEWQRCAAELSAARQTKESLDRDLARLASERDRLVRLRDAVPAVASRQRLRDELAQLGEARLLPAESAGNRRVAQEQLLTAQRSAQEARQAVEEHQRQIAQIALPEALLAQADAVDQLRESLGSYKTAQRDRPGLVAQANALEGQVAEQLRDLRPDLALAGVEALRVTAPERAEIGELIATLTRLTAEARTGRNRVQDQERKLAEAEAALAAEVSGATAGLPALETVDDWEGRLNDAAAEAAQTRLALEAVEDKRGALEAEINALRQAGDVPAEAGLQSARQRRDTLWQRVRAGELSRDAALAAAFEAAQTAADDLADRLRREADRVARAAHLHAELHQQFQRVERAAAAAVGSAKRHDRTAAEWAALCRPWGREAASPREVRAWLGRAAKLQEKVAECRGDLAKAQRDVDRPLEELNQARARWSVLLERLGLPSDSTPPAVQSFLEGVTGLSQVRKEAADKSGRIAAIDQASRAFVAQVEELSRSVLPELHAATPEAAVEALSQQLQQARTLQEQLKSAQQQLAREEKNLHKADKAIRDQIQRLALLCLEAGVAGEAQLPAAEERSNRRRAIQTTLAAREEEVAQRAAGTPLEQFVEQVLTGDPGETAERIVELEGQIERLRAQQLDAAQRMGSAQTELARMDGRGDAAVRAQDSQQLLASLAAGAESYARLKLASLVLDRAIEQYREKHRNPILARAGEIFGRLTVGRFAGLQAGEDEDGRPRLEGLRAGSGQSVSAAGMSEGTADQLYLALRLASVEQYLDAHEAVPFIVDDILIQFDNERAAATLAVLARLSQRTQVLVFTHHEHLLDLARQTLPADAWREHRLESCVTVGA